MVLYFVVLVTLTWLPQTTLSFSFTKKPEQPMVIVLNNNSTDVVFRWEFSLANGDIFSYLNFRRYEKDKGLDLASSVALGFYQTGYTNVNTTLYSLNTNVSNGPSSGYVSFTIKDIMKQTNNKDGSTADARSIEYLYQLEMKMGNILDTAFSDVEMRLFVKVHNFIGPKNETVNESEQLNVKCSADGKPPPSLTVVLPNGVQINGTKILDENITAYRNMTGMYNCTAENEVTSAQTKTAWLNVWFPASCAMSLVNVTEENSVTLNISTRGNPSVNDYICTHPNGTRLAGNGVFTFIARRRDAGTYHCSVYNGVGNRGNCTGYVNVQFPASCAMSLVNVTEENSVTLNISTRGNPSVNDYICTHPNGTRLAGNGVFTFIARQRDAGTYHCSVYNGVGNRGNCTGYVNVQYSPGMPLTFVAQPANACRGGYINLACSNSSANPAVSKYVFYNGVKLLGEKESGFFQANKTTLGITVFWCVPFNSIGKGKNISVNVTVHENPSILNPRINDATTTNEATPVVENEELKFTFFYNGTRKLNETWKRHDGKPRRGQKFEQASMYGLNFSLAHRNDSGVYEIIARDDYGCFTVKRFNLSVHYIDPPKFPCYKTAVVGRDKETFTLNMTVDAHPDAEASCNSTSKNASLKKISKVGSITTFSLTITDNDTTRYTCLVKNGERTKSTSLQVYQTRPSRWIEGHFKIINLTLADVNVSQLNGTVTNMLENIYGCVSYVKKVHVERFSSGSVLVDFKVLGIADINTTEYLKPVKDAVFENSVFPGGLQIDYTSIKSGYSPVTSTTTSTSSTATPPVTHSNQPPGKPEVPIWIIVVVVAIVSIILVFVAIICYRKMKRSRKKDKEDETGVIHMDGNLSARNGQGISPSSDYADYGPSHTNPTFDHSVNSPKNNTNNNSSQTKSGKEKEESAYAAVDYTKKKKNKNPEELSYAKLEDFQNKKPQPKGSHDGIFLEHQPKGKNTKMPEKYQETIYADIVGTKKQGGDNQGDGATDASLNDLHKKDDETDKEKQPSDGNLGTTEEKEQKTVVKEKDNAIKPPVNHQVQPPTKEDTGKMKPEPEENSVTKFGNLQPESTC